MPASLIAAGALICTPLSDFASALGEKCRLETPRAVVKPHRLTAGRELFDHRG